MAQKNITKRENTARPVMRPSSRRIAAATVRVWRDYRAGVSPTTAQRVWEIAADFGGVKTIFPLLLSVYITYPDASTTKLNTARHMTFPPPISKARFLTKIRCFLG